LKIIGLLARDCRLSYERIGSAINLTRNSIKTRIKKMVSEGVIQEFIADIDFPVIGYRICYIITKQRQEEKNSSNKNTESNNSGNSSNSRKIVIDQLNQIGDILAEIEILGGASIFRVDIREVNEDKESTLAGYNISSLLDTGIIEKVIPVYSRSIQSILISGKSSSLT
jgi:DNA-binding Lrp family transcriptional regulator